MDHPVVQTYFDLWVEVLREVRRIADEMEAASATATFRCPAAGNGVVCACNGQCRTPEFYALKRAMAQLQELVPASKALALQET